jgi:hypothetical protein
MMEIGSTPFQPLGTRSSGAGKDPVLMTTAEFIEATEHIEGAEGDATRRTSLPRRRNFRRRSLAVPNCKLHGTPHDTKDCKVLKARDSGCTHKERIPPSTRTRLGRERKDQLRNQEGFPAFNKAVKQQLKTLTGKKRDLNALEKNEDGEVSDDDISLNFDYSTIANLAAGSNKDYDTADEN